MGSLYFLMLFSFLGGSLAGEVKRLDQDKDLEFSPCRMAETFRSLPKYFGHAHHPGFWTCVAIYNSASYRSTSPSFAHRCRVITLKNGRMSRRCDHDWYGIFNLGPMYGWCEHKVPLVTDLPSENRESRQPTHTHLCFLHLYRFLFFSQVATCTARISLTGT